MGRVGRRRKKHVRKRRRVIRDSKGTVDEHIIYMGRRKKLNQGAEHNATTKQCRV
jgi:hypothetical protein